MATEITGNALQKILELRKKNGLEATEEALQADLAAAKTKYTLEETPRYRKVGESPLYIAGKYLTSRGGVCPATGEREEGKAAPAPKAEKAPKGGEASISEEALVKVLAGKGFKFTRLVNTITGELVQEEKDPKIARLNLTYQAIPKNADHDKVYVQQTSPQIQVAMTLERFLELAGLKP